MDAALKIVIGADTSGAITGLKTVTNELEKVGIASKGASGQFNFTNESMQKLSAQTVNFQQKSAAATKILEEQTKATKAAAEATKQLGDSGESVNKILGPLNSAYSAIRKIAYVLPGIGIAGIFNLAFQGIAELFKSVDKAVDDSAETLKAYKKVVDDVVSSNAKESATVDILVGKIQSGTLSRQETVKAINELRQIAPDYFGKLNAEKASIEDVTKAYGNYNNALIQTIETQIRIAEITDIVKKRLAQATQTPEAAKFIADLQAQGKSLQDINAIVTKGIGEEIHATAQLLQNNKLLTKEQETQAILASKIPGGVQQLLGFLNQEADILKDISKVGNLVKLPAAKELKPEKEDAPILPVQIQFVLDGQPIETATDIDKKISKLVGHINPKAHMAIEIQGRDLVLEQAKAIAEKVNQIIDSITKQGIINLSESIGGALASGGNLLEAAFGSILDTLGTGVQEIGKQLIVIGGLATVAATAIKSLISNPVLTVVAGAALVALGSFLKGKANSVHAFAEGGIVTGPTNALIGEAGPEVIFPLEKLNQFIRNGTGPGNMNIVVAGMIKGNDLKLVLARANKSQSLV